MQDNVNNLVGKSYIFEDGNSIKVVQIKNRQDELGHTVPVVTYEIVQGKNAVPRKLLLKYSEFDSMYGHLFK